jgi:hypothetical protein
LTTFTSGFKLHLSAILSIEVGMQNIIEGTEQPQRH